MQSTIKANQLLSIQQAAHRIGISTTTLYKWVSQRRVPHIKIGRLVKFDLHSLEEWIHQQTVMPMPSK